MKVNCLLVFVSVLLSTLAFVRAEQPIAVDSRLEIAGSVAFTEGPAWHPNGTVFFSDIVNNRIMQRNAQGEVSVHRSPSGRANGLLFDRQGRLMCCEGGERRVTRIDGGGQITVLADQFGGKPFNSPNDLTIDSRGRVYFTDPRYGDKKSVEQRDENGQAIEGVYRIDRIGSVTRIIAHEVDRPNGILVSPGDKYLYVADNVNDGPRAEGGNRKLWRFDLQEDGSVDLESRHMLFDWETDRGPDGMVLDRDGRIYVAAGFNFPKPPVETAKKYKAGVYVISPEGKLIQFIPVPADMCTNCTFGGDDLKTLFVTAGHTLWSIRTNAVGHLAWPR